MISSIDLIDSRLLDRFAKLEILSSLLGPEQLRSPNGDNWSRLKEAEQSFCVFPALTREAGIPTNLAIQIVDALPVSGKIDGAEVAVRVFVHHLGLVDSHIENEVLNNAF